MLSLFVASAAARAGRAALIVAVEREVGLARLATAVFAVHRHRLPATVRLKVVAKATRDLVVGGGAGADLPRRADLIVSEIFGDDPLAEGASAYMLLGYQPPHTATPARLGMACTCGIP